LVVGRCGWVVLFDWDGTLVDSLDIKVHNAGKLFAQKLGLDPQAVEASYRRHSGVPRHQLFEAICRENGLASLSPARFDRLSEHFSEMNLAALSDPHTPGLVPEATPATLRALQARGCRMYVSSSSVAQELELLAHGLGLRDYFDGILGSRPGFGKGPQHVAYVIEETSTSREQIVMIGDDVTDVRLGQEAGVLTVAKTGTHTRQRLKQEEPGYIIDSLRELVGILESHRPVARG
jgi:phosphoglycolate phosphatase-like HAD superfamily hydrolase